MPSRNGRLCLAGASLFLALVACDEGTGCNNPTPTNPMPANPCPTGVDDGAISGRVLDNGYPLYGVSVDLTGGQSGQAMTDADGAFSFPLVSSGDYTISISGQPGSCQDTGGFSRTTTVTGGATSDVVVDVDCSSGWVQISAGRATCALRSTNLGYCWGRGGDGALGNGQAPDKSRPSAVATTTPFSQIEQIFSSSCGLTSGGAAFCWGENTTGGLGTGNLIDANTPQAVQTTASLDRLGDGGCAIDDSGTGYCWGGNDSGQVGDGTTEDRSVPTVVAGGLSFAAIGHGERHGCGLTTGGATYCWGDNQRGQLGQGSTGAPVTTPVEVTGAPDFVDLTVGREFNCGVTGGGQIWCWGRNLDGQVGVTPSGDEPSPVRVGSGSSWTAVAAGSRHTCAIQGSQAFCWGAGDQGQLGNGAFDDTSTPTPVSGGLSFSQVSAGVDHSCGLVGGDAYCWGRNQNGEIGDGTETVRGVPTLVGPAPN
ncbi:MAG: hypothetical protein HKO53_19000 [Gemmatimonadetes bacterium]|nr:hypothetical protein [Gemmatimonadota bacterium]